VTSLRVAVSDAMDERLRALGFSAGRRDGRYLSDVASQDVRGYLGLSAASYGGTIVRVDPFIGVRHERVEQFAAALGDGDDRTATVLRPLFELLPVEGYHAWHFSAEDLDTVAEFLEGAIREHGLPFIAGLRTLDAIEAALRDWSSVDVRRQRLPIVAGLRAGPDAAREALDIELAGLSGSACQEYAVFAEGLLERLVP